MTATTKYSLVQFRREIRRRLESHSDRTYLSKLKELVPTGAPLLGVRVPIIKGLANTFHSEHKNLTMEDVGQLLNWFCKDRCREEILFGVFLLARFKRHFSLFHWKYVRAWVEAIDNWETCDQLAMNVAGELVARDLSLVEHLVEWTKSQNPWKRRFAVATTSVLNQKGRSHPQETFRVCEPLMNDADPMVQKAVAWAVREASKKDEPAAFVFLKRCKNKAHPRVFREGCQKLTSRHRAFLLG